MAIPDGIAVRNAAASTEVMTRKIHQDLERLLARDRSGEPADGEGAGTGASGEWFNPEGPVGTKEGGWCFT